MGMSFVRRGFDIRQLQDFKTSQASELRTNQMARGCDLQPDCKLVIIEQNTSLLNTTFNLTLCAHCSQHESRINVDLSSLHSLPPNRANRGCFMLNSLSPVET